MRMWEIREGYDPREISYRYGEHKGMKSKEEEAYCEGYEDGYGEAMELASEKYGNIGFRGESRRTSGSSRGGSYGSRMGYRDEEDDDDDMMNERRGRRRRDSRGRYM